MLRCTPGPTLIAGTVLWLVDLVAVGLIFSKKSNPYYRQEPAQR
jgi:hypothetical protein